MPDSSLPALICALTPPAYTWWMGRRLVQRLDDPALPEILLAHGQRLAQVTAAGLVALVVFFGDHSFWSLPLLLLTLLASRYPLRRQLFAERWSIGSYLRFGIFSFIGGVGLWLAVAFLPLFVLAVATSVVPGDDARRAAGIAAALGTLLGAVLLLWQWQYGALWLHLHRATSMADRAPPSLLRRFDEILDRAGAALHRRPAVYRYGAPGGHMMNALAIPSLQAPAIALGDTLLDTLTENEIVAVFAHEVAHHEQFDARRLRRARWSSVGIVLLVVALPPALLLALPRFATLVALAVPVALALALGRRAARSRADETASDRRAVALTGDGAALASALWKLHVTSRLPRRWPHDFERVAGHPSLARRIQAIESVEAAPAAPPGVAAAFRGDRPDQVVVLDAARAHWFEGVPAGVPLEPTSLRESASAYRVATYGELCELRVVVAGDQRLLSATDREGRCWSVALQPADVPAVQTALDAVDVRLASRPSEPAHRARLAARVLVAALTVALLAGDALGVLLLPIGLAMWRPTRAALLAVGTMALARGIAGVAGEDLAAAGLAQAAAGVAAAIGAALVFVAIRWSRSTALSTPASASQSGWSDSRPMILVLLGLAVLLAFAVAPSLTAGPATLLDHPMAPTLATVVVGLGAALAGLPRRHWRVAGIVACAVAMVLQTMVVTGGWPGRRAAITWTVREARAIAPDIVLGGYASAVELSPDGSYFVVRQPNIARRAGAQPTRLVFGRVTADPAASRRQLDMSTLVFIDGERALTLSLGRADSVDLGLYALAELATAAAHGAAVWSRRLAPLDDPQLFVDRVRGEWTVVGRDSEHGTMVLATGSVGQPRADVHTLAESDAVGRPIAAFGNGTALVPVMVDNVTGANPWLVWFAALGPRWKFQRVGGAVKEAAGAAPGMLACSPVIDGDAVVSTGMGGRHARVWRAPAAGPVVEVAEMPRGYDLVHGAGGGRLVAATRRGTRVALVDPSTRSGIRVRLQGWDLSSTTGTAFVGDVSWSGDRLAILAVGSSGSRLSLYRLD